MQGTMINQQAEETEQELIDEATAAISRSNWIVGELASRWTQRYAAGRTDEDFAELIGSSRQTVNYARRIWDRFCPRGGKDCFRWREWKQIVAWDDADECLDWAEESGATFAEMNAWRRARRGEDLTEPEQPQEDEFKPAQQAPPPDQPIVTPPQPAAPKSKQSKSKNSGDGPAVEEPREPTATSPEAPDLRTATRQVVKTIRQSAAESDVKTRRAAAKALRKLSDELDPPATGIPPSIEDVTAYCDSRKNGVNPNAFWDFYQSKGWMVGAHKMKDWKAAVRNAEHGDYFKKGGSDDGYGDCPF